jgi:hypothetical protein
MRVSTIEPPATTVPYFRDVRNSREQAGHLQGLPALYSLSGMTAPQAGHLNVRLNKKEKSSLKSPKAYTAVGNLT